MQLFVLVSTGQRVANLPPVLELAQPGDRVLWIESDEAQQRNWTIAPRLILEENGLQTERVVSVSQLNDPFVVASALEPIVSSLANRYQSIYLVTNGGTKHTPIGLLGAFHRLSPKLLYGDERPAGFSIYPSGFTAPPQVSSYTRHKLDLPDILRVNGYTLATPSEYRRIWPNSISGEITSEQYGIDESYTCRLHTEHFAWASIGSKQQRVRFENIYSLVPDAYQRWIRTLEQVSFAMNQQNLCSIYNGTLNLAESAAHAAARRDRGIALPVARVGNSLERAVARRVWTWQAKHQHPAIQSIWIGAKIAREETPHCVEAEFDILLVLKNGVLVHLECKSANAQARQLDINTHRLRQAGSLLAGRRW